ncbi:AgrD family cyclic lactone autoinducer peptide [Bacillus sp. FSL K6-3431]
MKALRRLAKIVSEVTHVLASSFVTASSPVIHAPKIPESLKKTK